MDQYLDPQVVTLDSGAEGSGQQAHTADEQDAGSALRQPETTEPPVWVSRPPPTADTLDDDAAVLDEDPGARYGVDGR